MKEVMEKVRGCLLFQDIPETVLEEQIMPQANVIDLPKNSVLIQYQEKVDYFCVVISGKIHTLHSFEDGSYSICHVLHPGGVTGVDLLWTGSRVAPYFAVAAEASRVLRFPASLLEAGGGLEEKWRLRVLERALALISLDHTVPKGPSGTAADLSVHAGRQAPYGDLHHSFYQRGAGLLPLR